MKTLHYSLVLLISWGAPYLVQRWDRSRLSEEAREIAWNSASWGAAVYNFAQFSMIGWVWVSRTHWPWWLRILVGVVAAAALSAVIVLLDWVLVSLIGLPEI